MIKTTNAVNALIPILLVIALTGCATNMGRDFNETYAQQIKPGEMTKAQVLDKLGQPSLVTGTAEDEIWTYAYYEGKSVLFFNLAQDQGSQKRLIVTFKGDGVTDSRFTREIPLPNRANR